MRTGDLDPHLIHGSMSPPEPTTETASRSVQPFLHSWWQTAIGLVIPNYVVFPPKKFPFAWGIWTPSNTCFLGLTRLDNPNGISISSAIFAQLTAVSSGMPGHTLSPKNCLFGWGFGPPSNNGSLGPSQFTFQTISRSVQPFLYSSHHSVVRHVGARPSPQNCPCLFP